tara:strand:- start:857 stop:988 length:132 start_codon:yes stop_codon:yes gene_type:complete
MFAAPTQKNREPAVLSGGPEGIRTPGHRVKSPALYLTKLQAHG